MLSQKMVDQLNAQINLEFYSSNMYLQMSAWADSQGLEGTASFLKAHAAEEMGHMHRLFSYVNETGAMALIGAIEAVPTEFNDIADMFQQIYDHELLVTRKINELAHTAFSEQDYSSFNFLQWYVAEQHEEEALFKTILDKIQIIGTHDSGLFLIDQEISRIAKAGVGSVMSSTYQANA